MYRQSRYAVHAASAGRSTWPTVKATNGLTPAYAPGAAATRRGTFLSFAPPAIAEEEIGAVSETLRSGWLTTGPRTAELESRMRDYFEAKPVLAVSSCTAALHLSLVALGVGPGAEVITTSITWPATANVIVHCGATPVFADGRDDTLNIYPEQD